MATICRHLRGSKIGISGTSGLIAIATDKPLI